MTRARLPTNRRGLTSKMKLGEVAVYVTVNRHPKTRAVCEVFAKATHGHQGHMNALCLVISIALQYGVPAADLIGKLRHQRYHPEGMAGQPSSLADAVARAMEAEA